MRCITTLLLLIATTNQAYFKRIRPRCHSDFRFSAPSNESSNIYQKSWQRDCSNDLRKICTKNVTIAYYEMEPFTTRQIFTKSKWPVTGILQQILSVALAQCCGSCIKINFNKVQDRAMLNDMAIKEKSDILFPIFTQGQPHHVNASLPALTTPIIHIPGAMFITKSTISATIFAKEVVMSILDIWPLLGVSLLLAFAAGVIMWIIDTWWNKEHFPRRFFTGSFEGFWWAFISMTTVGYGDRAPKSVPGRLFAVFWILCGITITALMTAALTTAIGVVTARQIATINRGTVGILKDHVFEKSILMQGNAHKRYRNNINELVKSILRNEIDAMLLDSFTAKSFKSSLFIDEDLYLHSVIQDIDQSYLGVTIYDEELQNLIHEYIEFQHDAIKDFIYEVFQSFDDIKNKKVVANLLFTSDSGIFWPTVFTCIVILGVTLVIGAAYELYRLKKKGAETNKRKEYELTLQNLKNEENNFEDELTDLVKRWEKHLLEIMKGYSLRGIFSKTNKTYAKIMIKLTPLESDTLVFPSTIDADYQDNPKKKKVNKNKNVVANGHYKKLEDDGGDDVDDESVDEEPKKKRVSKVKKKPVIVKKKKVKKSQTSPEGNTTPKKRKKKKKPEPQSNEDSEYEGTEMTENVKSKRKIKIDQDEEDV